MIAALRIQVFRRFWSASLFSNFGLLVQGVGAAWAMTELTSAPDMVALVQTATMAPYMLFALGAGAIADTYDRRKVGLTGMSIALAGAVLLTVLAWSALLTPYLILILTFTIGSGIALFAPAWQASVVEQVPPSNLPAAIALNSISYNIARSFGPAIGGVIVALAGATAAFLVNVFFFLPMILALLIWRRVQEPSRLPPERLMRAVISGARYVFHSPSLRMVMVRCFLIGVAGSSILALMPLIARDLLQGDASLYGTMLGIYGIGAVLGALVMGAVTQRLGSEGTVRLSLILIAIAVAVIGVSASAWLTGGVLLVAGACWMIGIAIFNIGVQTVSPRWVTGRALASFQTASSGGIAIGSWLWGYVATETDVGTALLVASGFTVLVVIVGRWLPISEFSPAGELVSREDPEIALEITDRSGPVVIEVEYCVPADKAREFYGVMLQMQLSRQRTGAYGWSIARDLSNPELWTERYHCPTWLDYLRQRNRLTRAEVELHERSQSFQSGVQLKVKRMLERPFGSVRWREDVREGPDILPIPPGSSGH